MSDQTSPEGEHPPSSEDLRLAYEQVHNRYAGITDFRAKLLGLLPLVTGTSAFLLLAQVKDPDSNLRKFLGPMGILGLVVTLGLFIYELRGMQRCQELEKQGRNLEKEMKVGELGPFHGPPRALGSMLGAPVAGLIIYIATAVTWLCLALYGFRWSISLWWGFLVFIVLLVLSWIFLRRWLRLTSTKPSSSDPQ